MGASNRTLAMAHNSESFEPSGGFRFDGPCKLVFVSLMHAADLHSTGNLGKANILPRGALVQHAMRSQEPLCFFHTALHALQLRAPGLLKCSWKNRTARTA